MIACVCRTWIDKRYENRLIEVKRAADESFLQRYLQIRKGAPESILSFRNSLK